MDTSSSKMANNASSIKPAKSGLYSPLLAANLFNSSLAASNISFNTSSLVAKILNAVLLPMVDLVICWANEAFLNFCSYATSMAAVSDRTMDAFSISNSSSAFNLISLAFSWASFSMKAFILRSSALTWRLMFLVVCTIETEVLDDCCVDLMVSMGKTPSHMATPARPPAIAMLINERSSPGLESDCLMCSYVAKYNAAPGPSAARVATEPLKIDAMPPVRYISATTAPIDLAAPSWICIITLTRSNGAATNVVGMAERKPAVEMLAMVNWSTVLPVYEPTIRFPTS